MYNEDISKVNDNFDGYKQRLTNFSNDFELGLFIYIFKKNLFLIIAILFTALTIALIYLHYTPPIYESRAVLQIQKKDNAKKVLNVDDIYEESSLTAETELIKSYLLVKRTVERLPLGITYYKKGEILNNQLYPTGSFVVNIISIDDSSIIDRPIYITFIKDNKFEFSIIENKVTNVFQVNKICSTPYCTFIVKITDKSINELIKSNENLEYFFKINSNQSLASFFMGSLGVNIANQNANTVSISSKGNNPQLSRDFLMAHAREYIEFDLESKEKSSKNILEFIDNQLDTVYENLRDSELLLNN
jgi:tyrosine-protein kinase Etk/Wzc